MVIFQKEYIFYVRTIFTPPNLPCRVQTDHYIRESNCMYNAITLLIARGAAECKLIRYSHEAKPSLIIAVKSRGAAECNNWCNRIIPAVRFAYNSTLVMLKSVQLVFNRTDYFVIKTVRL